jgi:hypothetical protein
VEILAGPGEIRGNYFEITGRTHVACGSDRGNSILMSDNIVHVKEGGDLDIAFRSWADSERHVIANNTVTVDPGGRCGKAVDARGYGAVIMGNNFHTTNPEEPLHLTVSGGNTVVTGNILENVVIEIDDRTGSGRPILVNNNILENSAIEHRSGNLVSSADVK